MRIFKYYMLFLLLLIMGMEVNGFKFTFHFLWFDLWIGLYIDQKTGIIYFCPFPAVVFKFAPPKSKAEQRYYPAKPKTVQEKYREAGRKLMRSLKTGGWGHAIWCNFQNHKDVTQSFCNCGVTNFIRAYEEDTGERVKWEGYP